MGRKIKAAHLISTSGLYGAEQWILALANHLKEAEPIIVCTNFDDKSLIREAKKQKIKTRLLDIKGNYAVFDAAKKLSSLIKEEKIDILHTHGYKADIIGFLAKRKTKKTKIISTPHGWSKDAGLKLKIYESLDRFTLRFFDLVVPHTTAFKSSLKHIKKIAYIHNFVNLNKIPKPKQGDPKLLTYIGQLIERKRVQDIIRSLQYLPKEAKLQIIGDGPKKQELKQLTKKLGLEKRVTFQGFRKDRLDLLNRSKILILPSLLDWIPRVMMEAMAMERNVIGTDIPGIRRLIKDRKTGLLVPLKSPRDIAKAASYIQKDKKHSKDMAKEAKELIVKKFSARQAAAKFEKLYKNLAAKTIKR